MIGYTKSSSTFNDTPKAAIIKANSPICAKLKPDCIDVLSGCPDNKTPNEEKKAFPTIVTNVIRITGHAYCTRTAGSTNIPTETKKIAPNRSFTGLIICSIRSASIVSARIDPIIKAPSAAEKPVFVATTTIPRHNPKAITSNVSSFISFLTFFNKAGITKIPTKNQRIRKKATFRILPIISSPANSWLTAIVESNTIMIMATRSSTTNVPNTIPVKRWFLSPKSSKAFMIIVVDDIDNIPPRKMEFIVDHPSRCPIKYPTISIVITSVIAVIKAVDPTFISFLKLNSSPRANNRKTTPISAQRLMFSTSTTVGKMWI